VGRLLGDPEVWDDSQARPRPAVPGLVGLAAGAGRRLLACPDPEVVELCDRVVRLVDGRPVELDPDSVGGPVA